MKKIALVLAAMLLLIPLSACNQEDENTILIGGLAPLTGDVAVYGIAVRNAADLAFEEINEKGGILGKQIKYQCEDEKGDPTEAVNAFNKLMNNENIVAFLGDVTTKPTLAVAPLAAEEGIPMITPTATHVDVTKAGDNIFRSCFIDPFQGSMMAVFAKENLNVQKVAIIYNTSDDYSDGLHESFKEKAEELGMEVVAIKGYSKDATDFNAELTAIQAEDPDAIYVPDYYGTDALIATQARALGFNKPLLGCDGWDGVLDVLAEEKYSVVNNVYFTNHYFVGDTDEKVKAFVANYEKEYGVKPNALAALAYDAAYILANAIEAAGSTDWAAINKELAKTSYAGVSGNISYGDGTYAGDPTKDVTVIKIDNGEYNFYTRVSP